MRARILSLITPAAILLLPIAIHAQKFQEPTREELEMTVDPKAPGAPAVFLYREELMDNSNHFQSSYARIKVLTELGKEWATVEVPYEPEIDALPNIQGRTIHPDGTIIPLEGKAADLLLVKAKGVNLKVATFNLPSVEIGSILEYRWTKPQTRVKAAGSESSYFIAAETAGRRPEWDVQQDLFVHKEHFHYNPVTRLREAIAGDLENRNPARWMKAWSSAFLLYKENLPPGFHVVQSIDRTYTLDITDVPPIHHEAYGIPLDSLRYRVYFYLTPYTAAEPFWSSEHERWLKELNQFAAITPAIRDAAKQITDGADSAGAKARKLYEAVQSLDNTDFAPVRSEAERQKHHVNSEPGNVEDIWTEKSGNRNDLAALYLAFARAAGLEAFAMQVSDRSKRIFDPNLLTLQQLDALLVVLRIDGKDVYIDAGEKLCPFGQLRWTHTIAGGLREDVKGPVYTPANAAQSAVTAASTELTVDKNGAIAGEVKFLITGPEALHWRQLFIASGMDETLKQFNEFLRDSLPAGVESDTPDLQGLDSTAINLTAVVRVSGQLGSTTSNRLLLPAVFFSQSAPLQLVAEEKRESPIDLHYAEQLIDDVVYHLPDGFRIESAPQSTRLPWPDHAALAVSVRTGSGTIGIKHILTRAFAIAPAKDYAALRDYYQKLTAIERQQVVLAGARSASAN